MVSADRSIAGKGIRRPPPTKSNSRVRPTGGAATVLRLVATRIGIDTGGTFTDVVRVDGRRTTVHKRRS
ncbi:MAG TPA: hypothetical protein ENI87_11005, partial [bacterium]|nr:hypothetical protein [bacterium]